MLCLCIRGNVPEVWWWVLSRVLRPSQGSGLEVTPPQGHRHICAHTKWFHLFWDPGDAGEMGSPCGVPRRVLLNFFLQGTQRCRATQAGKAGFIYDREGWGRTPGPMGWGPRGGARGKGQWDTLIMQVTIRHAGRRLFPLPNKCGYGLRGFPSRGVL